MSLYCLVTVVTTVEVISIIQRPMRLFTMSLHWVLYTINKITNNDTILLMMMISCVLLFTLPTILLLPDKQDVTLPFMYGILSPWKRYQYYRDNITEEYVQLIFLVSDFKILKFSLNDFCYSLSLHLPLSSLSLSLSPQLMVRRLLQLVLMMIIVLLFGIGRKVKCCVLEEVTKTKYSK